MMRWPALILILLATPTLAQSPAAPRTYTKDDLRRAEAARDAAVARVRALEGQSSAVARDLSLIEADLVAAGADSGEREAAAYAAEEQLMILSDETETANRALSADQAALQDLLAALMTLSARRPPAIVTSPEDSATAIRAAILMSDAAPALAKRAEGLRGQIAMLNHLADETRRQQANLVSATAALAARREEINALAAEKRRALSKLNAETRAARNESRRLAEKAETLRDLLETLGRTSPATPGARPAAGSPGTPATLTPRPDRTGLKPAVPAAVRPPAAAGLPVWPARGARLRYFGQTIAGAPQEGLTLATRQAAQVVAPLDARVEYSGVFRSYGHMVILDVGGDVLVVVAGLDVLYPETGQWVLAGEPIGRMSDRKSPSPELYLEIRRKGQPVDPEKWLGRRM